MANKTIITISRQYGSGGHYLGKLLAQALDIPFYDKELINIAAQNSGFDKEIIANADEQAPSWLNTVPMNAYFRLEYTMPMNDRIFQIQSNVIKELAAQGSCVIVGRCAEYVLGDNPHLLKLFIYGQLENRIKRAVNYYDLPANKVEKIIIRQDKLRASYYDYYAGIKWGSVKNYHLALDSDLLPLEELAGILKNLVEAKEKNYNG